MKEKIKLVEKYNLWNGNTFPMGYVREGYIKKIYGFLGNKLVKVLVGQRRCGKSFILRQIAMKLVESGVSGNNILYLNREFIDFDFLQNYKDLDEFVKAYIEEIKPSGKIYIFIDEIQNIDEWERFVNSYSQDFTADYELIITGSNSKMLSGELSTLLSGRYVEFEIFPFSYSEYLGFYNLENLFDTIDDPNKNDEEFLPNGKNRWNTLKYSTKLEHMAYAISTIGTSDDDKFRSPDGIAVLGLS